MHIFTPLKTMLTLGEESIREAIESGDPELALLEDIQMYTAGLSSHCPDFAAVDATAKDLANHAQSVWLSALRQVFSGQVAAIPPSLRNALESICYSLLIAEDPSLAEAWLGRHDGEEGRRASKAAFGSAMAKARDILDKKDDQLGDWMYWMYMKLIDEGAHPNPKAIWKRQNTILSEGRDPFYVLQTTDWFSRSSHVTQRYIIDCAYTGLALFRVTVVILDVPPDGFEEVFRELKIRCKELRTAYNAGVQGRGT